MEQNNQSNVVIIGGGPAGLTAAYELSKSGIDSVVLEKDQLVGGISRTVNHKDYYFDLGGHRFFTKIPRVEKMWHEVLREDFLLRKRMSRIYYNKKFFYYPLRPLNALSGLGLWNSLLILVSYLYAHTFPSRDEANFEQWVSNRFGRRLYSTFFKAYTEKVWGIPCGEIRAEWAAQRIRGLSLVSAIRNALIKPPHHSGTNQVIKTLIDRFHYPRLGPGMMWKAVARILQENGSQVRLGEEVEEIHWSGNRVEALETQCQGGRRRVAGTDFISSMPIRELVQKLRPAPPANVLEAAGRLNYRDFMTVVLIINKRDIFPDNWIYIHDPDVKLGRIQNFKNWSASMVPDPDKTCLGLEYFCFEGDALWTMADEDLIALGTRELETLGLAQAGDVLEGRVVRMPKAYPVYDTQYEASLLTVRQFLDTIGNLQLVGRNGMHRYNNQDHSMYTAMLAAENIQGALHNLWEVNEEQEYHEEEKMRIPDEVIIRAFSRMDKLGFAAAIGTVSGLLIFFSTLWLILKGGEVVGPNLQLLNQYFIGYTVSVKGAFIGMGYSFFWGFIFGWLFAYLRNLFLAFFIYRAKRKAALLSFRDFLDHF